ncbi:hypothetical protein ABTM15_19165, partial [Acinetobacter baumannii]
LSYGEDIAERDGILALPEQVFGAYLDIRQQCRTAPSWSVPFEKAAGRYHITAVNQGRTVRIVALENHASANARHEEAQRMQRNGLNQAEALV